MSEKPLSDGEVCQSCSHPYDTVYHVPDSVWARMLPDKAPGGLLCIPCAIRISKEKGIELWWEAAQNDFPTAAMREAAGLAHNVLRGLRDDDLVPTSRIEDADEAIVALHLGRLPGRAIEAGKNRHA